VTVAALEAGKHALVEKPLATADEDALAMMAAARRTGTLLLPAFLLRFDRRYALAAERVAALGPVRSAYAWRNFDRGLFRLYSRTHSFIENAIHDIDLLGWLIGSPVVRVTGVCRTNLGLPNPDVNWGLLEYESGAVAALQTTWLYPEQAHDDLQWNAGIQLMADGGVVEVSYDQGGLRANTEASGILLLDQSAWADVAGEPRGAFGAMLRHVIACLQGRVEYQGATAEDALASMRVARALVASAEQGTPIDVAFGKDLSA
jgi:predicted dehydrogenase